MKHKKSVLKILSANYECFSVFAPFSQRLRLVQVATAIVNRNKMFLQLAPNACYHWCIYVL